MATSREILKYYFRKYALPTEQQFAELIDAFVHKDEDLLTQEKIEGLVAALESKVSTKTFESFQTKIQNLVTEAGGGYDSLAERMSTVEDYVSGHETRIKTLEDAPKGNFVKQIADLDSYEGSEGEIVQYIGATNDKYRRGFCYEKVKNNPTTHTEERTIITLPTNPTINGVQASTNILREVFLDDVDIDTAYSYAYVRPLAVGKHAVSRTACKEIGRIQEGYGYYDTDNNFIACYSDNPGKARFFEIDDTILVANETVATNVPLYLSYLSDDHTDLANGNNGYQLCLYSPTVSTETVEVEDTMEGPVTSWQVIPTSPCVN